MSRFIHTHDLMRERLLQPVELINNRKPHPTLRELRESENHHEVWELCDNRMLMGSFRYELIEEKERRHQNGGCTGYDLIKEAHRRIALYEADANLEHLIDAINMLALEFRFPRLQGAHFTPVDDGQHAQRLAA